MNKSDFQQDTRYTVTYKDEDAKLRPANIYVMRLHEDGMIVRFTDKGGNLKKLAYEDIVKIVKKTEVAKQDRFYIPDAVLSESNWKDRKELNHYSSMPHAGK